jgi:two-component system sensor histidine kinase PhoQ
VYAEKSPVFLNQIPEASEVAIEEDDLMELIGNILDNAVKHGGNTIKIRASQAPDLRIVIQDDGPGFPEEPGAMLTRGVRADSRIPGQGIGLAVANEIALAYGMRIDLESSSQGAQVTIHHALSSAV